MIAVGTTVNFVKIINGVTVTGHGSLTEQASEEAYTVHIKVETSSHPRLLAVNAYAKVTRVK